MHGYIYGINFVVIGWRVMIGDAFKWCFRFGVSLFVCLFVCLSPLFWGTNNSRTEANFFMKIYQTIAYILEGLKCKLQLIIFLFAPGVNKKGFLTALRDTPWLRDTKSNVYVRCAMNAIYI